MDIAQKMLSLYNDDPDLLKKVITGDELWVYGCDIETKPNHSKRSVQRSQERKKDKSKQEMLTTFNDNPDLLKKFITGGELMLVREFLAKNETVIMSQIPYSPELAPWLFPLPKTEDTDERKAFCYNWGDKRKIETGAVGDAKMRFSEVFQGL